MNTRMILTTVGCGALLLLNSIPAVSAAPTGAKAIFASGEGPSVSMYSSQRVSQHATATPKKTVKYAAAKKETEKYIGVSYQLMLLSDDGRMKAVTKSRTFRSGERVKMLVRTNRPGYLTIVNVGSSGNTNMLFNEYVDAYTMHEIPRATTFKFVGAPGTERLMVMLSDSPTPFGGGQQLRTTVADNAPVTPPASSDFGSPPPTSPSLSDDPNMTTASNDVVELPPPPTVIASAMEGVKSLRGAKDIVVDDNMQTSFAVISPKNRWKPAAMGGKDIVLESEGGNNFGVVPASAVSGGGILTMQIKLRHR